MHLPPRSYLSDWIVTAPQFRLNRDWGDNCAVPLASADASVAEDSGGADGGVNVLLTRGTGPFEITLLRAESVNDLRDWLDINEYQIPNGVDESSSRTWRETKSFSLSNYWLAAMRGIYRHCD